MTVPVRWPAGPAVRREADDFFATFCISEGVLWTRQKVDNNIFTTTSPLYNNQGFLCATHNHISQR